MRYNKKNELDVDFIGGEGPLTSEEKKALNDYFNSKKLKSAKLPPASKNRVVKREKLLV
jgi:hypothetical protein